MNKIKKRPIRRDKEAYIVLCSELIIAAVDVHGAVQAIFYENKSESLRTEDQNF